MIEGWSVGPNPAGSRQPNPATNPGMMPLWCSDPPLEASEALRRARQHRRRRTGRRNVGLPRPGNPTLDSKNIVR